MNWKPLPLLAGIAVSFSLAAAAADWPQYRGPNHDGICADKILPAWPAAGLHQFWKQPLKDGFSSFSVGGGKVFTVVAREVDSANQEVAVAMDAKTGAELWAAPLGVARYDGGGDSGTPDNKGGDGPRSTPSLAGDKVYLLSSRLVLKCVEAATGKEVWASDLMKEHAGRNIHWENAASPLVEDGLVFVAGGGPGEALLAFSAKDGKVVWKGQDDMMTQSTPVAATILGVRQVIFITQTGLVAVAPKTGSVLWRQSFPYKTSTGISPVVSGDIVYSSAAYGVGAGAYRIAKSAEGFSSSQLWFEGGNGKANHWSTPVVKDGYLYGICDQAKYGKAPLKCLELATGKEMWTKPGFGPGGCLLVDGKIMVLSDAGDLVLIKPDANEYSEISRTHILGGKCWNVPAISNGRLYARSTKEGVCVDISPKGGAGGAE